MQCISNKFKGRSCIYNSYHFNVDGELFFGDRRAVQQREEARNLFVEFHASPMGGHTGLHKTRQAMCARYYWHGMSLDIEKWVCITVCNEMACSY